MIKEGLMLMMVGMGSVLIFLSIMVTVMTLTAAFFKRFAHHFKDAKQPEPKSRLERMSSDDSEIAVIVAALKAYKSSS